MNSYKCVNCGGAASALYKTYGPSVLKLTKCASCKGVVDKYIEYDPVIVMIDLVLMSKEAQRHIIYNTEFKSYWKLFIILIMLETYGVWRNDSLFNIAINTICNIKNNSTINSTYITLPINISVPEPWMSDCKGWAYEDKESMDLFIWEKDFYIQFLSIFTGIILFITLVHLLMKLFKKICFQNEVSLTRVLKSFSLANMSLLFTLPMLVWGNSDTPPETRMLHYLMVFVYSFIFFYNTFRVLYESPKTVTAIVLTISYCVKYITTFHMTPFIRKITR
ncbi:protein ARV1 [Nymphalis io]|uniref:protein ARV1 n=1 Tax=Inachis io TaxID=171585 RepID=UPI0021672B2F|nr:protein ARV1 [Nymphalis io]